MGNQVGVIGCGSIGRFVAQSLIDDPDLDLGFILEPDQERRKGFEGYIMASIDELEEHSADLVVEAARANVVKEILPKVISLADILILSVAVFSDEEFLKKAERLCQRYKRHIYIPHASITGLDGIRDAREIIERVVITTKKSSSSLGRNDPVKKIVLDGSVDSASLAFPKNVNFHAAIALAGLGFHKTQSRVISDPDVSQNEHTIEISGLTFHHIIQLSSEQVGPSCGAYVPISAYNSIRQILVKPYGLNFL